MTRHRIQQNRGQSRLSRQVEEAISLALGASGDARLRDLVVHSVVPSDGGVRLVVRLVLAGGDPSVERIEAAYEALTLAGVWLRGQVAEDIHRKRAPELELQVFPSWDAAP